MMCSMKVGRISGIALYIQALSLYRVVQKKGTVLLSISLAWPAVAGCSWAETFSQLSSISFALPCILGTETLIPTLSWIFTVLWRALYTSYNLKLNFGPEEDRMIIRARADIYWRQLGSRGEQRLRQNEGSARTAAVKVPGHASKREGGLF